jgi:hypothetical protein
MARTSTGPGTPTPNERCTQDLETEIRTLNLMWLLSARELARSDADKAALVYGLDQHLRTLLRDASLVMLRDLAASGVLLFRPRFRSPMLKERLEDTGRSTLGLELQTILLAAEEIAHS